MSARITKGKSAASRNRHAGGLKREYRFDYRKSKPNRFAKLLSHDAVVVVLDSDVSAVFRDAKRVNSLLRATIAAVTRRSSRRAG